MRDTWATILAVPIWKGEARLTRLELLPASLCSKLPDLKIAKPIDELEYTPLERDVGMVKLPVTF